MWVFYGLLTASFQSVLSLMQEKLKMQPLVFAVWTKVYCPFFALPFLYYYGVPTDPLFYLYCFGSAALWSVADIIMWKEIPIIGAGVFSRTIPLSVIINFLLWFLIDHDLIFRYLSQPILFFLITVILVLSTYFTIQLKKCNVTNDAFRRVWLVIVAFVMGPIMAMLASKHAPVSQGPWNFLFFESLFMLLLWFTYVALRKPVPAREFISTYNIKFGAICGLIMAIMVTTYLYGLYHTDNPAYIAALISLDAVFISFVHRILKKKDESNIKAGIGIVACAIALVFLKAQLH